MFCEAEGITFFPFHPAGGGYLRSHGAPHAPGEYHLSRTGFYPSLVGFFLLFTSGSFVLWALFKGKAQKNAPGSGEVGEVDSKTIHRSKTLLLIALLLFYVLTLNFLGFLLAISIFIILSIRIFGYRRWLPSLGITAAIVAISYLSFVVWLKVPLPQGILGDLLEGLLG